MQQISTVSYVCVFTQDPKCVHGVLTGNFFIEKFTRLLM